MCVVGTCSLAAARVPLGWGTCLPFGDGLSDGGLVVGVVDVHGVDD